jgi:hypothetical protein
MRIFYCAQSTPNETALPHSRLWHVNLCLPLQDLGHELIAFDRDYLHAAYNLDPDRSTDQPSIAQQRPRFGEELLAELKRAHRHAPIDVFFSYFASAHVEADIIREDGDRHNKLVLQCVLPVSFGERPRFGIPLLSGSGEVPSRRLSSGGSNPDILPRGGESKLLQIV